MDSAAFDAFAASYDSDFTHSLLGKLLRQRVWEVYARHFQSGQRVLELACGTGEDALWLAGRGVQVTATDGSAEMVRVARAKAAVAGLTPLITTQQLSLQELGAGHFKGQEQFDGAYSNFGGLNTIGQWQPLAEALAGLVRPGGRVVLVPMGPFCPWEMIWSLGHGQPRQAFRRLGARAEARIGPVTIPIWYPTARRLQAVFVPWFDHVRTESLALWLPPTYLGHLVNRWPALFDRLCRLETATARFTGGWGDHYIIVFQRKAFPAGA